MAKRACSEFADFLRFTKRLRIERDQKARGIQPENSEAQAETKQDMVVLTDTTLIHRTEESSKGT
jgi:hypothetical protein